MSIASFSAPREAYGLSSANLQARYNLICKDSAQGPKYFIEPKSAESTTTLNIPLLIKIGAHPHCFNITLTNIPSFRHFSRTISGAEPTISKIMKAVKRASYLNPGCAKENHQAILLDKDYWQEAFLDHHPNGTEVLDFFDSWKRQKQCAYSFEDWLKLIPIAEQPSSFVTYYSSEERANYEVTVSAGKILSKGITFCTSSINPLKNKTYAIYVISPDNKMYIGPYETGKFHHSSFLHGKPVIGAGEIKTSLDGIILEISSKSGHYKPTARQVTNTFSYLEARGVNLEEVNLIENVDGGVKRQSSISDFIRSSPDLYTE